MKTDNAVALDVIQQAIALAEGEWCPDDTVYVDRFDQGAECTEADVKKRVLKMLNALHRFLEEGDETDLVAARVKCRG